MSTPSWVPAIVAIDEHMGPYAAQILVDQRWNGWVVPRFTREVAQQVVADLTAINTAAINNGEDVDPFEAELARFDGDDIVIIQAPGTDEEHIVERVPPMPKAGTASAGTGGAGRGLTPRRTGTGCTR
jgi:hypothetical protein